MKYNFDNPVSRRGTNSLKWDSNPDVLPMWVADMDFEVAPCISKAIIERANHPVYGYNIVPPEYYQSVVNWFGSRHGWTIDPSWILYTIGVVPAVSAVIKALAHGDGTMNTERPKVLTLTPAYNCFFSSIRNNDCELAACPLKYENGEYSVDYELFETLCSDPSTHLFLLCNPHNPSGRVWTAEELTRMGEICQRHGVIVVSDEIHCEIVMPGYKYTPFASLFQHNCITLNSSSKSFNTAGLQIANIISDNPLWRKKIDKAININEVCDVNPFGIVALMAAYSDEGADWLAELNEYIYGNYQLLRDTFAKEFPSLNVCRLEGTYLAWVDCTSISPEGTGRIEDYLLSNEKVWINSGLHYGQDGFIRINLATSRALLTEGLSRIVRGLHGLFH